MSASGHVPTAPGRCKLCSGAEHSGRLSSTLHPEPPNHDAPLTMPMMARKMRWFMTPCSRGAVRCTAGGGTPGRSNSSTPRLVGDTKADLRRRLVPVRGYNLRVPSSQVLLPARDHTPCCDTAKAPRSTAEIKRRRAAHREATCHSAHGMQKVPRVLLALKLSSRSGSSSLWSHTVLLSAESSWQPEFFSLLGMSFSGDLPLHPRNTAGCELLPSIRNSRVQAVAWHADTVPQQMAILKTSPLHGFQVRVDDSEATGDHRQLRRLCQRRLQLLLPRGPGPAALATATVCIMPPLCATCFTARVSLTKNWHQSA